MTRPMKRRFIDQMEIAARAAGYEGVRDRVTELWVFGLIEGGASTYSIWKRFEGAEFEWMHPEQLFYDWLNEGRSNPNGKDGPDGRRARYKEAQRVGALATSDMSEVVLERLVDAETGRAQIGVSSVDVQLADRRSRVRSRLAAQRDPESFGEGGGSASEIGDLFLKALERGAKQAVAGEMRKRLEADTGPPLFAPEEEVEEVDAEVVE